MHFLQQIVTGRKSYIMLVDIKPIKVPIRPELSVATVWPDAIRIPGVSDHVPDEWDGGHRVDRKFFWGILTSLHPEYVQHLIKGSREARNAHRALQAVPQQQLLEPNPLWVDTLLRDEGYVPARK